MKPRIKLDSAKAPDGTELTLHEHDGSHEISVGGAGLMTSRQHESELELGRLAVEDLRPGGVLLIGGLGLGFTLRAVLDGLPEDAKVIQVELIEKVVAWNRGPAGAHAGHPLEDPRVEAWTTRVEVAAGRDSGQDSSAPSSAPRGERERS